MYMYQVLQQGLQAIVIQVSTGLLVLQGQIRVYCLNCTCGQGCVHCVTCMSGQESMQRCWFYSSATDNFCMSSQTERVGHMIILVGCSLLGAYRPHLCFLDLFVVHRSIEPGVTLAKCDPCQCLSMIDWIRRTFPRIHWFAELGKMPDHRGVASDTVCSQARLCWAAQCIECISVAIFTVTESRVAAMCYQTGSES